jgi:hypothetical protein
VTPSISRTSLQIHPPRHRRSPRGVTHSDEPDLRSDPAPPEERVGRFLLPQMPSTQGVSSLFPELFWSSTDFFNFSTGAPGSSTRHPPVHPQPVPSNPGRTGAVRARLIDESLADRVDHSGGNAAITQVAPYSAVPAVHMLGVGPTGSSRRSLRCRAVAAEAPASSTQTVGAKSLVSPRVGATLRQQCARRATAPGLADRTGPAEAVRGVPECWREITGSAKCWCEIAPTATGTARHAPRSQAWLRILTRRVRRSPCRRGT